MSCSLKLKRILKFSLCSSFFHSIYDIFAFFTSLQFFIIFSIRPLRTNLLLLLHSGSNSFSALWYLLICFCVGFLVSKIPCISFLTKSEIFFMPNPFYTSFLPKIIPYFQLLLLELLILYNFEQ